jgi:MbtH protein
MEEKEDNTIYKVVVNHEEQYSIWPADRENPLGWKDAGKSGSNAECLPGLRQGSLDGYEAAKLEEKNGRSSEE